MRRLLFWTATALLTGSLWISDTHAHPADYVADLFQRPALAFATLFPG